MLTHSHQVRSVRYLAVALLAAASYQASAAENCGLRPLESPTNFPLQSQLRGQSGTVLIAVSVDRNGRATGTQLLQSSGYLLLDRAAAASVRNDWQFDITGCERKDLPATRTVAVEYRNDEYAR